MDIAAQVDEVYSELGLSDMCYVDGHDWVRYERGAQFVDLPKWRWQKRKPNPDFEFWFKCRRCGKSTQVEPFDQVAQ